MSLILAEKAEDINNPNEKISSSVGTEPTLPTGYSSYNHCTWYYKKGSRVCMSAVARKDSGDMAVNTSLFTLPQGYRPKNDIYYVGQNYANNSYSLLAIYASSGLVSVKYTTGVGIASYIEFDAFQ